MCSMTAERAFYMRRVVFWGKVQGKVGDYMIAQGLGEAASLDSKGSEGGDVVIAEYFSTLKSIPKRTYMMGADGISWAELPKVKFPTVLGSAGVLFREAAPAKVGRRAVFFLWSRVRRQRKNPALPGEKCTQPETLIRPGRRRAARQGG